MHVPVKLEFLCLNWTKWYMFFRSLCDKFGLISHIDRSAEPAPTDAAYLQMDGAVRNRLLTTVANDILDLAEAPNQDAHDLFVWIESVFNENKESRAVYLSNEFNSFVQGDLSSTSMPST